MRTITRTTGSLLLVAGVAGLVAPPTVVGQEAGGESSCTLRWESLTDSTTSRSIEIRPDEYRHHVWNGMRWFCGDAVMTADSAVQYPGDRVVMVGSVRYRDSIRTLNSRRLTYYQASDHVEARDSVRLVRRSSGSILEAPSVDLFRGGAGTIRQTVASGGTRMTVYPPDDTVADRSTPYRVTSREAHIYNDDVTVARDEVVITREDLRGTADLARFGPEGDGELTGDAALTGEDYRLTGDTIRTISSDDEGDQSDDEIDQVQASGSGHLESRGMDVRAPQIRIRLADGDVRNLWAYGGGARSRSTSRVILGDSIHIALQASRPDSVTAVGEAAALEIGPDVSLPWDGTGGGEAGSDTVDAGPEAAVARADSAAGGASPSATPDSAGAGEARGRAGGDTEALFTMERDWIRGDTVRARFGVAGTDSLTSGRDTETDSSPVDEVTLEELRALGNARAYYRVARDTARDRRGRNFLQGKEIIVEFREGDPERVLGFQAIGVYLEPAGPGATSVPGPPPDTGPGGAAAPPDTAPGLPSAVRDTSSAADTARGSRP